MKLNEEKNRLKMLRAQVKPHTFLNGITTISNMTYSSTPEQIRKYISAFAKFTRYMLHTSSEWTTINDERQHIENYISMQKIRFPNSIELAFECPTDLLEVRIPMLLLFSLVENSFKHAMTLYETLYLKIKVEEINEDNFKGVKITEEDSGAGFSEEMLQTLNNISENDLFTKEHLGLTNTRYTLNLIYQRNDLLHLSNREEGGARIEVMIPYMEVDDETAAM